MNFLDFCIERPYYLGAFQHEIHWIINCLKEAVMRKYMIIGACLLLLACGRSGPAQLLENLAQSMENNNPQAFLSQIDMSVYSANQLKAMTSGDDALGILNSVGRMLGLGNIDSLIGNMVDIRSRIEDHFMRGVASGELMAQCRVATTPDCPWVPKSLRDAQVVEIGPDAAIAKVTTPARLTSWLAMRRINGQWLLVGQAVLEAQARKLATSVPSSAKPQAPASAQDETRI